MLCCYLLGVVKHTLLGTFNGEVMKHCIEFWNAQLGFASPDHVMYVAQLHLASWIPAQVSEGVLIDMFLNLSTYQETFVSDIL